MSAESVSSLNFVHNIIFKDFTIFNVTCVDLNSVNLESLYVKPCYDI